MNYRNHLLKSLIQKLRQGQRPTLERDELAQLGVESLEPRMMLSGTVEQASEPEPIFQLPDEVSNVLLDAVAESGIAQGGIWQPTAEEDLADGGRWDELLNAEAVDSSSWKDYEIGSLSPAESFSISDIQAIDDDQFLVIVYDRNVQRQTDTVSSSTNGDGFGGPGDVGESSLVETSTWDIDLTIVEVSSLSDAQNLAISGIGSLLDHDRYLSVSADLSLAYTDLPESGNEINKFEVESNHTITIDLEWLGEDDGDEDDYYDTIIYDVEGVGSFTGTHVYRGTLSPDDSPLANLQEQQEIEGVTNSLLDLSSNNILTAGFDQDSLDAGYMGDTTVYNNTATFLIDNTTYSGNAIGYEDYLGNSLESNGSTDPAGLTIESFGEYSMTVAPIISTQYTRNTTVDDSTLYSEGSSTLTPRVNTSGEYDSYFDFDQNADGTATMEIVSTMDSFDSIGTSFLTFEEGDVVTDGDDLFAESYYESSSSFATDLIGNSNQSIDLLVEIDADEESTITGETSFVSEITTADLRIESDFEIDYRETTGIYVAGENEGDTFLDPEMTWWVQQQPYVWEDRAEKNEQTDLAITGNASPEIAPQYYDAQTNYGFYKSNSDYLYDSGLTGPSNSGSKITFESDKVTSSDWNTISSEYIIDTGGNSSIGSITHEDLHRAEDGSKSSNLNTVGFRELSSGGNSGGGTLTASVQFDDDDSTEDVVDYVGTSFANSYHNIDFQQSSAAGTNSVEELRHTGDIDAGNGTKSSDNSFASWSETSTTENGLIGSNSRLDFTPEKASVFIQSFGNISTEIESAGLSSVESERSSVSENESGDTSTSSSSYSSSSVVLPYIGGGGSSAVWNENQLLNIWDSAAYGNQSSSDDSGSGDTGSGGTGDSGTGGFGGGADVGGTGSDDGTSDDSASDGAVDVPTFSSSNLYVWSDDDFVYEIGGSTNIDSSSFYSETHISPELSTNSSSSSSISGPDYSSSSTQSNVLEGIAPHSNFETSSNSNFNSNYSQAGLYQDGFSRNSFDITSTTDLSGSALSAFNSTSPDGTVSNSKVSEPGQIAFSDRDHALTIEEIQIHGQTTTHEDWFRDMEAAAADTGEEGSDDSSSDSSGSSDEEPAEKGDLLVTSTVWQFSDGEFTATNGSTTTTSRNFTDDTSDSVNRGTESSNGDWDITEITTTEYFDGGYVDVEYNIYGDSFEQVFASSDGEASSTSRREYGDLIKDYDNDSTFGSTGNRDVVWTIGGEQSSEYYQGDLIHAGGTITESTEAEGDAGATISGNFTVSSGGQDNSGSTSTDIGDSFEFSQTKTYSASMVDGQLQIDSTDDTSNLVEGFKETRDVADNLEGNEGVSGGFGGEGGGTGDGMGAGGDGNLIPGGRSEYSETLTGGIPDFYANGNGSYNFAASYGEDPTLGLQLGAGYSPGTDSGSDSGSSDDSSGDSSSSQSDGGAGGDSGQDDGSSSPAPSGQYELNGLDGFALIGEYSERRRGGPTGTLDEQDFPQPFELIPERVDIVTKIGGGLSAFQGGHESEQPLYEGLAKLRSLANGFLDWLTGTTAEGRASHHREDKARFVELMASLNGDRRVSERFYENTYRANPWQAEQMTQLAETAVNWLAGGGLMSTPAGGAASGAVDDAARSADNLSNSFQQFWKRITGKAPRSTAGAADIADDFMLPGSRLYELNPKHGTVPRFDGSKYIGKRPTNPIDTLDDSLPLGGSSRTRRVGHDPETGEIVIYDRHGDWWDRSLTTGDPMKIGGKWHGHVRPWDMLDQKMKKTLIDAGWFNRKGKYLGE